MVQSRGTIERHEHGVLWASERSLGTLAQDMKKLKAFSQTLLPDPATDPDDCGTHHSPACTDLRIDWADACSLGRHGELYFFLVVDKGTEYLANYNSKTRQNPVDLLRAYITTTGKAPRYLRVDGAKEFESDEMVAFCTAEKIVLQVVVAYNHTMQARVGPLATSNSTAGSQCSRPMYPHDSGHRQQPISSPRSTSFGTRPMHHVRPQQHTEGRVDPSVQMGVGSTENHSITMAQELCRHLQRCLKHEDVARQLTLCDLHLACEQWACDSLRFWTPRLRWGSGMQPCRGRRGEYMDSLDI